MGNFHLKRPLLMDKRVISLQNLNTLYFYHNRLVGYDLEVYLIELRWGVIGSGNFGTTVKICWPDIATYFFTCAMKKPSIISYKAGDRGHKLNKHITPINDLAELARQCDIIFPIVPSAHFRAMMKSFRPTFTPTMFLSMVQRASTSPCQRSDTPRPWPSF